MPTFKASNRGKEKIKLARIDRGWKTKDIQACIAASKIIDPDTDWQAEDKVAAQIFADGVSLQTWIRFQQGTAINVRAFKAFCQVLGLEYQEICESSLVKYVLVLSGNIDEFKKARAEAIIEHLKELLEDPSITLKEIESGSIVLVLEGSLEGYEKLQAAIENGLTEIAEMRIEDLQLKSDPVQDLRDWLESLWEDWQPVEKTAVAVRSDQEPTENSIIRAKKFDLGTDQSVVLTLKLWPISISEIQATISVYPDQNVEYLPEELSVAVLDNMDNVVERVEAKDQIDLLMLSFSFETIETFKIELSLADTKIIENVFEHE